MIENCEFWGKIVLRKIPFTTTTTTTTSSINISAAVKLIFFFLLALKHDYIIVSSSFHFLFPFTISLFDGVHNIDNIAAVRSSFLVWTRYTYTSCHCLICVYFVFRNMCMRKLGWDAPSLCYIIVSHATYVRASMLSSKCWITLWGTNEKCLMFGRDDFSFVILNSKMCHQLRGKKMLFSFTQRRHYYVTNTYLL